MKHRAGEISTESSITLAYAGRKYVVMPGELLFDRVLSDSEKIYWSALRALCENITQFPDQQVLADALGKNRTSINSYNKMLRATRWIRVAETVRQNNLPTRQTCIIYDNPLPLLEAVNLDSHYLPFIISEADQGKQPRLRDYCRELILNLDPNTRFALEAFGLRNKLKQSPWYQLDELPAVENSDSGESPAVENSDSGESPAVENSDNGESPAVENSDNGESSAVENSDSGESPAVENSDSGESSGDVYNHARTHARSEPRASAPTQIGIKSSVRRFNQTSNQPDGWGCGGRKNETDDANGSPFAFLDAPPLSRLMPHLQKRYGNKTTHAILNRLKAGHYTFRDERFSHRVDADEAAIVLMSLLDREVNSPLNFVDGLIRRAAQSNLTFQGGQYQRFQELTADPKPEGNEKPVTPAPELPDGTRLIGRSGTRYRITGRCLINEATGANGGPGEDGVHPFRVQGVEEIAELVQAGCLRIVTGGEE